MLHSRIERVQKMIQHELAGIIDRDLQNPNLPDFITIARVKVSNDLSRATVLITFLQDQPGDTAEQTVRELNHSAGYIRRLLAQRVHLKRHPDLKFIYTDTTRHALEMETLFQQIRREREERERDTDSPEEENLADDTARKDTWHE